MQFQILGPLRVTDGGEHEVALGGAKPSALLAMLLLRPNEVVSPDRLIEDLWDGQPPATAAKTLQVHISRLRRALGDDGPIVTSRSGYRLEIEPDQVDALRFEALVTEGTAALAEGAHSRASARLRSALALWRGDALADFAYASFAQDAIARLDGLRTVALESAVEAELALGRHAELIPELKSLVKRHPLSEHLRGQLMLALYRAGRQAEALGVYRAGRRVLVDQLGIEPSAELRDLERAILAHDEELAAPSPQAWPRRERADKSPRGTLVGYEHELGALEDVLEQALARQGRLALIAGEPGVGKTRLADELSSVAHARGAQVVWGRCSSDGGAPAYWPWIQLLRALIADRAPVTVRAELGAGAPELTQLLPELRDLLPGIEMPDHGDAEEARFRLFDAAAGFLVRAAAARPIVIVLDDLHIADRSSLSLLQFMAAAALDGAVLIVGTYRDTQAALERPLSDTLNELARTTDCLQLVLTGLSSDDTAHFVEVSAGVSPLPALSSAIHEVTSGNPLFVSELVRLLAAEDRLNELQDGDALALPRGVDQVIARRLERLSEPCRATLALAAVIGRDFDVDLLTRAGDAPATEVLAHIDDAIAVRVVDEAAGTFRFSHDLVRHTLYAALGPVERRRMHESVATALELLHARRPEPVVADLAHHFSQALPAGDPAKAIRYLTLAGDAAAQLSASEEAADLYSRAAEVETANGGDPALLGELYVKLAEQLVEIPDLQRAKEAVDEADVLVRAAPDRSREARVAVVRAHLHLLDDSSLDEEQIFDALALFDDIGDPLGAARAWWALVVINCGRSDRLRGNEAAERMLDCAKRGGSRALTGRALGSIASSMSLGAAPASEAIVRTRALLDEAPDTLTRAKLLTSLAKIEAKRARFDEARSLLAEVWAMITPRESTALAGYIYSAGAQVETYARNWLRAEELARADVADLESHGLARYLSSELMFLVDALIAQGRLEEAAVHLERAAPLAADDDADALFRQARSRARLELARGDIRAADTAIRIAVGHVEQAEAPDEHAETLLVLADVLRAAGRDLDASDAAERALQISIARENVPLAHWCREFLGATEAVAPAMT
jgi:DNA-binding SARP family transcriptional activator